MKKPTLLITWLFASASLLLADGIPVDRKTGKVRVPHTVVSLTEEQVEETQTLGTFTLTPDQWREIRKKSPQCPKRFDNVVPVTWNDCTCGLERGYAIALSRDRVAVLHEETSDVSVQMLCYELFEYSSITLRMNERGEFHLGGRLIPFPLLLKALATPPDDARRKEERFLFVELPVGSKQTDAVFESRLRKVAAVADKIGLAHQLFPREDDDSDFPLKPSAAAPAEAKGEYRPGGEKWKKVWNKFYAGDHEPELDDPLIEAGKDMTLVICEAISNRDMCRRRYAIGALGFIGDRRALPTLEGILRSKEEAFFFRGDALQSIYQIDKELGKKYAAEYGHEHEYLEDLGKSIKKDESWLTEPTSGD